MPRVATKPKPPATIQTTITTTDTPSTLTHRPEVADDLFAPLSDLTDYARVLMYGREGSGKTTAAAAAAASGRVLVINAEGGLKKVALRGRGINTDNLVVFPSKPDVEITHRLLDSLFRRLQADLEADPNSWYAVVMDSMTDIVESLVGKVSDVRVLRTRERGVKVDEVDEFFVDRSDYGTSTKMVRDLLRKFRNLPCHLVITALERVDADPDTSGIVVGPAVNPAVQTDLLGYVDMVLAYKAGDDQRPFRALTHRNGRYRAKDRFGVLPPVLYEPSLTRILGYLNGELTPETDPIQLTNTQPEPVDHEDDDDTEEN